MRTAVITLIMVIFFSGLKAQENARLYGRVTDLEEDPLDSVTIRLKNKQYENLYETITDKEGKFSLMVKTDNYYCLYAIKASDYKKTKLEYWTWNVPVYADLEINPQYNNKERRLSDVLKNKRSMYFIRKSNIT